MDRIIIQYGDQRRLINKPPTYEMLVHLTRSYFSIPASTGLAPRYFLGFGGQDSVDVTPENYGDVPDCAFLGFSPSANIPNGSDLPVKSPMSPDSVEEKLEASSVSESKRIFIVYNGSCKFEVNLEKGCTIAALKKLAAEKTGYDRRFFGLSYEETPLRANKTIEDYHIQSDSAIDMDTSFGVAKQAIYLRKPAASNTIDISLTVSCKPPFSVKSSDIQPALAAAYSHTWSVSVREESADDVHIRSLPPNYAFHHLTWTGETPTDLASIPLYRPPSPGEQDAVFDPWIPFLTPGNAYVLQTRDFIPFLKSAFEELDLTPQMRSDFLFRFNAQLQRISDFWPCVAFHFVSQGAFSKRSKIQIDWYGRGPRHAVPAVVSRIFLLFGGIKVTKANWMRKLVTLEQAKAIDWADEIGLDVGKMWDDKNLRIIEVGAMEVPLFRSGS